MSDKSNWRSWQRSRAWTSWTCSKKPRSIAWRPASVRMRVCDYTTEVEPDSDSGYCENCCTNTVKSCLVLGGII